MEGEILHVIASQADNNLLSSFLHVLEKNVGTDYYSYLYISFNALESLINNNLQLRSLIEDNNRYLDNYLKSMEQSRNEFSKFKKSLTESIDELFDAEYQDNLHEKVEEMKIAIDKALDLALKTNESLKPTVGLEDKIKNIKAEIKENVADINYAYNCLRKLKELKIFKSSTKQDCEAEFVEAVNSPKAKQIFNKLWGMAVLEAIGLNDIANTAKKLVLSNPTGLDAFNNELITSAKALIDKYDQSYSKLTQISDSDL